MPSRCQARIHVIIYRRCAICDWDFLNAKQSFVKCSNPNVNNPQSSFIASSLSPTSP